MDATHQKFGDGGTRITAIAFDMLELANALERCGNTPLADEIHANATDLLAAKDDMQAAWSENISRELKESQERVGSTLSLILNAALDSD